MRSRPCHPPDFKSRTVVVIPARSGKLERMDEFFTRVWDNLVARVTGPLHFRLLLQPLMATLFAVRDGLGDAREKRSPYLWLIAVNSGERRKKLAEGWKAVSRVFVLAVVIDAVYQFISVKWFYPGEALIVATVLALVPYLLIRGPVNRIAQAIQRPASFPPVARKEK